MLSCISVFSFYYIFTVCVCIYVYLCVGVLCIVWYNKIVFFLFYINIDDVVVCMSHHVYIIIYYYINDL